MKEIKPLQIRLRHPVSGLSHLGMAIVALFGFVWLVSIAVRFGSVWHIVSFALFGATMIMVFLASALYHLITASPKTTEVLRKIDHIAIYIFIAGCYTPICLVPLRGGMGPLLVMSIWTLAVLGAFKKCIWIDLPRAMTVGAYVLMGALALVALPEMLRVLTAHQLNLVFIEVFLYVTGAMVYLFKWPDPFPKVFGFHEIWHLFVIGGSASHFVLVLDLIHFSN